MSVSVSTEVGARLTAFDGNRQGENLAVVPKRKIGPSWSGSDWKKTDLDFILILTFGRTPGGARIALVHANVPDKWHARIQKGWNEYYWKPWKTYLRQKARKG